MKAKSIQLKSYNQLKKIFLIILSSLFCVVFYFSVNDICLAQKKSHQILYINSYEPSYSWSDEIEKGLMESLNASGEKIEFYIEYLDSRRFIDPKLRKKQVDMILYKYPQRHHDLVIVSDNAAFDFAIKNRGLLFPNVPIVFCGYNNFRPEIINGITNITGVNEEMDIQALIETAIFIQKDIKALVFILSTGEASSKVITAHVMSSIIPAYKNLYEIIILKDTPMSQIEKTLSKLKSKAALFLMGQANEVRNERALTPIESGRLIASAIQIPAYTLWDFHIGTGVLGGRILTGYDQGRAAGKIAKEILSGKKADDIPIIMKSPISYIFDYNTMKRFDIDIDALPKNSTIINKPQSLYESYKKTVWITIIVFTLLSTLLIILVINVSYRYRAENELKKHRDNLEITVKQRTFELTELNKKLKESEIRFRTLSDASFEGIIVSEQGRVIDFNSTIAKMLGYNDSEMIGQMSTNFVIPKQRKQVTNKILSGYEQPYEIMCLRKDGKSFPAEVHGRMFLYRGKKVRVTAIRDISEKKKAEAEIKKLQGILPICMHCKGIRDDKGYWNQLERYIAEHSDVQFSHGICDKCMEKYHPEKK